MVPTKKSLVYAGEADGVCKYSNKDLKNHFLSTGRIPRAHPQRDGRQLVHRVRGDVRGRPARGSTPAQPGARRRAAARADVAEQAAGGAQQVQEQVAVDTPLHRCRVQVIVNERSRTRLYQLVYFLRVKHT